MKFHIIWDWYTCTNYYRYEVVPDKNKSTVIYEYEVGKEHKLLGTFQIAFWGFKLFTSWFY